LPFATELKSSRDKVTRLLLWCGIVVFAAILIPILPRQLPLNDFNEYWASARLFVTGGNPYSRAEMLAIQRGIGWDKPEPIMMFNPPWVLPLTAPLAAGSFRTAQICWFLLSAAFVFVSAELLWRLYGGRPDQRVIAWGCAALFIPNPVTLRMGQFSPTILFGLTLFLVCMRKQWLWLAGVSLFVLGIKPHLLIPVGLAVVFWVVREKRWQIIGGAILAVTIATFTAWLINPAALSGYVDLWKNDPPAEFVSGFGGILRLIFGFERTWFQFVPAVFGLVWILLRWRRYRMRWDWVEQMPSLLLGSLICAPYGWTFDEVVLLIAIMHGAVSMAKHPRPIILAAFASANLVLVAMVFAQFSDHWFVWTSPLWAVLYAAAVHPEWHSWPLLKRARSAHNTA
jgi:glycosyl transferase family 87